MNQIKELYQSFLLHPEVCTDSRKVSQGVLFFALKGENFDGNQYALQALKKGAFLSVVDDQKLKDKKGCFLVDNVLKTLQALAHHHRLQFNIPILGLTGTNGKTTTKELLKAVLQTQYKVHATAGNLNNHIGVPLTLLSMPTDTEIAIIEMGANHPGEIAALAQIAAPTHGCITNVGRAHLEGFGSFDGVKKTKAELYQWLGQNNGIAFINTNEKHLEELAKNLPNKYYYTTAKASSTSGDFFIAPLSSPPYIGATILDQHDHKINIKSQLVGDYNFENIKTALAIGHFFNIKPKQLKEGIEGYQPSNNRSQLTTDKDHNTIIMDAYNANPVSMEKALRNLANTDFGTAPKIAIIGDMLELGKDSRKEHKKILALVKELNIHQTIVVGNQFCEVAAGTNLNHFTNVEKLKEWFSHQNITNSIILIKGSRGIRLEQLLA